MLGRTPSHQHSCSSAATPAGVASPACVLKPGSALPSAAVPARNHTRALGSSLHHQFNPWASRHCPCIHSQQQRDLRGASVIGHATGTDNTPASAASRELSIRPKPYLVRIAGRTSDVAQAAGAIVKRLRTEDVIRVAAIDEQSVFKAMLTLTAANNMAAANTGHMLVFQPTAVTTAAAEPPAVPAGSMVMYTAQLLQGEVLTSNFLRVNGNTKPEKLARAIIARLFGNSHTVLECYGQQALIAAIQAMAQARKGLLVRGQDTACIIKSTPKRLEQEYGIADADSSGTATAAATDGSSEGSSSSSSSSSSRRPPLCHRLVLLECEPRNPRALLVRATIGVSDRRQSPQRS